MIYTLANNILSNLVSKSSPTWLIIVVFQQTNLQNIHGKKGWTSDFALVVTCSSLKVFHIKVVEMAIVGTG